MGADPGPPPRRILLVHERYQQAGGEDGVFDAEVALLRQRGHDVATVVVENDEIPTDPSPVAKARLAATTVWSGDGVRRIRTAIETFRPDVMHAHNTFPLLSPAIHGTARALGVATVQTLHNYRLVCPSAVLFRDGRPCHDCVGLPVATPGIVHACYRGSRAATAAVAAMETVHRVRGTWRRDVDRFIVLARFARDLVVRGGVPARRITILPNSVEPTSVVPDGPGAGYLFVGRLDEDKGVGTLLQAWDQLPAGIGLEIAGSGPLEDAVLAASRRNPSVRHLGRLDRAGVDAALARAKALVVPSHVYEACPLTVLEAFAAGRPVIGSGHGGIAELVTDGVTGLHARPADATDLARAVRRAESDPALMAAASTAAHRRYLDHHTPERAYAGLMDVFAAAGARPAAPAMRP